MIINRTDKNNLSVEYALGGIDNNIFTSKYTIYIPNKEILQEQVNKVIEEMSNKECE